MLTCKQISKALSYKDYEELSPRRKFMLKLHVKLCVFCGKFNRQIMESQDMCRHYKEQQHTVESRRATLDESKKNELKALLSAQSTKNSD